MFVLVFISTLLLIPEEHTDSGKEIYENRCASCHKTTGLGETNWFPPLINTPWVADETALVEVLFRGVSGTIYVQNKRYASFMSPYGRDISDDQLLLMINYIRQELNSYE